MLSAYKRLEVAAMQNSTSSTQLVAPSSAAARSQPPELASPPSLPLVAMQFSTILTFAAVALSTTLGVAAAQDAVCLFKSYVRLCGSCRLTCFYFSTPPPFGCPLRPSRRRTPTPLLASSRSGRTFLPTNGRPRSPLPGRQSRRRPNIRPLSRPSRRGGMPGSSSSLSSHELIGE